MQSDFVFNLSLVKELKRNNTPYMLVNLNIESLFVNFTAKIALV